MKVHSAGGWIAAALFLVVILWQLGQAVFMGRMGDLMFDEDDYLYFFESPILFCIQFAVMAGIGGSIAAFGWKELKKDRAAKADRTPRKTFDARQPRKNRMKSR